MSNAVTKSGQKALENWQSMREQERSLREAMTVEEPVATSPRRKLCISCFAGAGVLVTAGVLLGAGLLT
ncbi:hypothetical protein [Sagittula sp. S175]|uniref:hypothetical protein n=1 Tax=Sagittula sp. S175 TaxID=3415129 RepID=UPI003C7A1ABC